MLILSLWEDELFVVICDYFYFILSSAYFFRRFLSATWPSCGIGILYEEVFLNAFDIKSW